jgi:NAD(P)-dependent dehydrogenase (short-subunit alcohol dehydrogenase family)
MQAGARRHPNRHSPNPADRKAQNVSQFGSQTVMKHPAQPEIATAYVFLASPQCSSYITGEVLPIIGAYSGARPRTRRGSNTYIYGGIVTRSAARA